MMSEGWITKKQLMRVSGYKSNTNFTQALREIAREGMITAMHLPGDRHKFSIIILTPKGAKLLGIKKIRIPVVRRLPGIAQRALELIKSGANSYGAINKKIGPTCTYDKIHLAIKLLKDHNLVRVTPTRKMPPHPKVLIEITAAGERFIATEKRRMKKRFVEIDAEKALQNLEIFERVLLENTPITTRQAVDKSSIRQSLLNESPRAKISQFVKLPEFPEGNKLLDPAMHDEIVKKTAAMNIGKKPEIIKKGIKAINERLEELDLIGDRRKRSPNELKEMVYLTTVEQGLKYALERMKHVR